MEITTSVLTGPFLMDLTVPAIWLRALIFMVFTRSVSMGFLVKGIFHEIPEPICGFPGAG
jgi:hypothetical protein